MSFRNLSTFLLFCAYLYSSAGCSLIKKPDASPPGLPGRVVLDWSAKEGLQGFNLYRTQPGAGETRANGELVRPAAEGTASARPGFEKYRFLDNGVIAGADYYYYFEEVDADGVASRWETPRMKTASPLSENF